MKNTKKANKANKASNEVSQPSQKAADAVGKVGVSPEGVVLPADEAPVERDFSGLTFGQMSALLNRALDTIFSLDDQLFEEYKTDSEFGPYLDEINEFTAYYTGITER